MSEFKTTETIKNDKDKKYFGTLLLFENQELQKVIKDIQSVGLDPIDILKKGAQKILPIKV